MPPDVPARVPLPIAMPDDAFGAALIEQAAALSAYARRLTGGGADADDLLQDTMLRCWTARASFAAGTSLAAWARTVMKNSFLTGRRRARFHADLPEEARDRMLRVDETQSLAVKVIPQLGDSASTVVGLVNPVAGVAALIAGRALKNPIGKIFAFDYNITGTWSDPKVEKQQTASVGPPQEPGSPLR